MAVRRDKNGRWRYRKQVRLPNGKKVRISGCPTINTRAEAEAEERAHIERVRNPPPVRKEVPTFKTFSEEFMRTYASANNKPSEQTTKRYVLDAHLLRPFGKRKLDEIGPREIETLKANLLEKGKRPKSVNNIIGVLSRILSYAYEIGLLEQAPRLRRLKVPPQRFDFLDFAEYRRLREENASEPQLMAALLLAGDAGLRRGEIMALGWDDVDLRARMLTVRHSWWREELTTTKGNRERMVEMTSRLSLALEAIKHSAGPRVFRREGASPWNEEVMRFAIRRATKRAALREIGWHTLRHTFCSHLAMKGVPAKVIQELAGHSDLHTTLRYMHLSPSARRRAVDVLEDESAVAKTWQNGGTSLDGQEKSPEDPAV